MKLAKGQLAERRDFYNTPGPEQGWKHTRAPQAFTRAEARKALRHWTADDESDDYVVMPDGKRWHYKRAILFAWPNWQTHHSITGNGKKGGVQMNLRSRRQSVIGTWADLPEDDKLIASAFFVTAVSGSNGSLKENAAVQLLEKATEFAGGIQ